MNIIMIHQAFHPDPAGAARVLFELSRELVRRGHRVTVLTGNKTYSTGEPLSPRENCDGVDTVRVPAPGGRRSPIHRLAGMLIFTRNALRKLEELLPATDVVVASTLPPFLAHPAARITVKRGKAFVYVCHDIFPDVLVRSGAVKGLTGRILGAVLEYQTRSALQQAARTVVLSPSMKALVAAKSPGDERRIRVIPNFADPNLIKPGKRDNAWAAANGLAGKQVVLYAGNMGISHNLELLLDAAALTTDPDICFVFVGGGQKRPILETRVQEMGLWNVRFLPFQSESKLSSLLASALVSVIALEPELEGVAMPSKLYSIMASGRPCLVLQPPTAEIPTLVREAGIGVSAHTPAGVLAALESLRPDLVWQEYGDRARSLFEERYSLSRVADMYEEVLWESLLERGAGGELQ